MYIIRPIETKDFEAFESLVLSVGLGITSLPRSKSLQKKKIQKSLDSFQKNVAEPENENYVFVLENLETGEIGGCSAISSRSGVSEPDYYYKIETIQSKENNPHIPKELKVLHPISRRNGPAKIGSLFINPSFRKEGLGRLLSLSRFLFVATFRHRFAQEVCADMRALIDERGLAPFWEGLGRLFFDVDFTELLSILEKDKGFIEKMIPKYPIYANLLTPAAQEAIGKIHLHTKPALKMLEEEGFKISDEVDIFDGGPKIEAKVNEIRTVVKSKSGNVERIVNHPIESPPYLIANESLNFRACYGMLEIKDKDSVGVMADAADALQIKAGDRVRYATRKH